MTSWKKLFLIIFASGALSISCETPPPLHPNVLLIQMDDLGFDDIAHHGNKYVETPAIDGLASSSVEFGHFYVNPVCAPTRAALLTGRHYLRTGVSHVHGGRDFVNLDETLLSDMFRQAGYHTGMWGKWHSGKTTGYLPWDRGFDEAYMAQLYRHAESKGMLNGNAVTHEKWAEEVIVDYAIDFIGRNREKPFFAYLSFLTCHRPLVAPETIIQKYVAKGLPEELATLYAMIDHADQQLMRLFDYLETIGLDQNTIILFMSDNGPDYDAFESNTIRAIRHVNGLRGHKGDIWENGVRSPLFIQWGDRFQQRRVNSFVDVTDILPTLLDLCHIPLPEHNLPLDGRSFAGLLNGEAGFERDPIVNYAHRGWPPANKHEVFLDDQYAPVQPREKHALNAAKQVISITKPPYKLLVNPDNPLETSTFFLANLEEDPEEKHNLYDVSDATSNELKSALEQWWEDLKTEKNAFGSPSFLVGRNDRESIPLMAPSEKSPKLRNSFRGIDHWEKGEFANYQIEITEAGTYNLELTHSLIEMEQISINLVIQGQKITKNLAPGVGTKLGKVHLNRGDELLELSLNSGAPESNFKLFEINFLNLKE
jgi:uncharacterized sulfatase